MPDDKDIKIKNLETEKGLVERTKKEKKIERAVSDAEKREKPEAVFFDKNKTFIDQEQNIKDQAGSGSVVGLSSMQKKIVQRQKQIEIVLEKDLENIYLHMPVIKQREFKIKGERTAREINNLLEKTKIKIKKIINLIKKWLSIIPGINKFFLEQEAKIKADEIIKMKNNN